MSLYDRSYMYQQQKANNSGKSAMWYIIAINAIVYFFIAPPASPLAEKLICYSASFSVQTVYQLLTCGFIHADFSHLLFNMYGLYLFGSIVAPVIGEKKFSILYFSGILLSSLAFFIINSGRPYALCGASGAVYAVTIAAAMADPEKRFVLLLMPFSPIKITTMVICYTLLNFLFFIGNQAGNISYLAHLVGFIAGYTAMKITAKEYILWDPLKKKFDTFKKASPPPPPPKQKNEDNFDDGKPVSSAELDEILDKISRYGINSLSEYELSRLRRARQEMRGGK